MINSIFFNIFRKGSKTFFYSSLFFPAEVRDDVFTFYSFVRTADDFVDTIPQQRKAFLSFKKQLQSALNNKTTNHPIITSFVEVSKKYSFKQSWIKSFMAAMESDLKPKKTITDKQLNSYIYGSAEVIGLMLANIFKLDKKSYSAAKKMGKAMQLINFIRDIDEDNALGRIYFTKKDLKLFGLKDLNYETTHSNSEKFKKFIHFQVKKYRQINNQGKEGFKFLPIELLIPVKTATNMYEWTAQQIANDPFIIYRTKVKPSVSQILYQLGRNSLPL
jgi:phytoene synthase